MSAREHVVSLIPWYVKGTLAGGDRTRVEQHLQACRGCAGLLEQAAELQEIYSAAPSAAFEEHPQAQLLGEVAEDPEALEPEAVRWVLSHAAGCPGCGEALAACRALLAEEEPQPRRAAPRVGSIGLAERARRLLATPLLRPLPALAYLLAMTALAIPAFRQLTGSGSGAIAELSGEIVMTDELARAGEVPRAIEVPRGGALVLTLRTAIDRQDLQDPGAAFRVEIRSGAEVVWAERRAGSAFDPDGTIRIVVDRRRLVADRPHVVAIVYEKAGDPMRGRPVFQRAFVVTGAAGDDPLP